MIFFFYKNQFVWQKIKRVKWAGKWGYDTCTIYSTWFYTTTDVYFFWQWSLHSLVMLRLFCVEGQYFSNIGGGVNRNKKRSLSAIVGAKWEWNSGTRLVSHNRWTSLGSSIRDNALLAATQHSTSSPLRPSTPLKY